MKRLLSVLILCLTASLASAGTLSEEDQAYYRSLAEDGALFGWCQQVTPVAGGWEYYIDFYTSGGQNDGWGYWMGGFDTSGVQNIADAPYVRDIYSLENFGRGTDHVMPESVHVIEDYLPDGPGWGCSKYRTATADTTVAGGPPTAPPVGAVWEDRMWMYNWGGGAWGTPPGLLKTWRLVLDQQYYDGDLWVATSWTGPQYVYNLPTAGTLGDFDGDGDVDTDDIDILCNNMGDAAYDLDGDGDADADDFVKMIQELVELTDGSGRTGTDIADFNLDGLINATDLATMAANFGTVPPPELLYEHGNANCDELINATDLAVLAANFGYVAPTGAVPEPITVGLMAVGGSFLLARNRK